MIEQVSRNLGIPLSCKIDKKLFKKQFTENFSLNINERKILTNFIESITLEYLLNKDKINIAPYVDEDRDYSEIAFITVEILDKSKQKAISSIIQYIPYPMILFLVYENEFSLNITPKRINKSDSSKLVVEESIVSEWINLENQTEIEREFLKSLEIQNHPFINFYALYNSYLDKLIAFNASKHSGTLNVREDTKILLDEIAVCETKTSELKNKIKKETSFSDKVNLNIELKKMNDRLNDLKGSL